MLIKKINLSFRVLVGIAGTLWDVNVGNKIIQSICVSLPKKIT